MPVFESGNYVHTTDVAIAHAVVSARQESHAAALYAERSKRPPTVEGPPMITVEEAKPIVPYVTRVMCDGYEWRVICGMDQLKRYRIHRIEGEFEYCVSVQRHEFTVIDP